MNGSMSWRSGGGALAVLLVACSCMHAGPSSQVTANFAPRADSATILLWHMDEAGGDRVADAGPAGLDATAGRDTRVDFGIFGNARRFTVSIESFVYRPYSEALESPGALTVEAWIYPTGLGLFEDTPIAGRWTEQPNEQSWLFSLVGTNVGAGAGTLPSFHQSLIALGSPGYLMFAIQTRDAGLPQSYFSSTRIELNRWTHVAVSYDGQVVCFYVNGRLDAQYARPGLIRESPAPLMVGNYFDPRRLTDFGGVLQVGSGLDRTPYYAFNGFIDEFRLSRTARTSFPGVPTK